MRKTNTKFLIFSYIFIGLLVIIYVYPILNVVNVSLKTKQDFILKPIAITQTFNFDNYVTAFERANFATYIWNSIFYMAVCTLASTLMAVFLAFPISRKYIALHGFLYMMFVAAMFLPDGTIPQFQMFLRLGLYNTRIGYMLGLMG